MAKVLFAEKTPNPLAVKLKLDHTLTIGGSRHFAKKDDAWESPLTQKIFDIHGVESVFLMDDSLTINKTQAGIWDYIFFQVNDILLAAQDISPIRAGEGGAAPIQAPDDFEKLPDEEKLSYIDQVLDQTVRPGLARDGGGLKILALQGNILTVKYQGACGSCPSSTAQTLNFISQMLQSKVSPSLTVVPA